MSLLDEIKAERLEAEARILNKEKIKTEIKLKNVRKSKNEYLNLPTNDGPKSSMKNSKSQKSMRSSVDSK
jgi:hypothetical protein